MKSESNYKLTCCIHLLSKLTSLNLSKINLEDCEDKVLKKKSM